MLHNDDGFGNSCVDQANVLIKPCESGLGLFAAREFVTDEIIGRIRGQVVIDPGYSSDYAIELDHGASLEPSPPFRFINHHCEPNAELVSDDPDPDRYCEIYLVATSRIPAGREISIDYAWSASEAIRCNCDSRSCRGWIVCEEELHLIDPD